jgi:hypothetical protein
MKETEIAYWQGYLFALDNARKVLSGLVEAVPLVDDE